MNTPTLTTASLTSRSSTIDNRTLFSYFVPELITVGILYIGLEIINFRFLACTNIELCNATLFVSNSLFHFITKVAEGFSVGLIIICGTHNGSRNYKQAGRVLSEAFLMTACVGALLACAIFFGAHTIYAFFEVPQEIVTLGVPYLKIRAISVFFCFVYFAIIGFLRAIKNPRAPMVIFVMGALVYLFFDYALIFGAWGFPALGLTGSALATVIQFGFMLVAACTYLLFQPELQRYSLGLFSQIRFTTLRDLIQVSWPVMIDKASIAMSSIWLNKMIGCTAKLSTVATGTMMYDSLTVLKTMERVGMLPALAFAQVITYLVSNDMASQPLEYVKNNIKKVLIISCFLVGGCTLIFCLVPSFFLALLNKQNSYNELIASTLPFIAILIIFDVVQIVLSAALRGASQVQTVMKTRLIVTCLLFIPLSYGISYLPLSNPLLKFMLLYSSGHISYALMGFVYIYCFKRGPWRRLKLTQQS